MDNVLDNAFIGFGNRLNRKKNIYSNRPLLIMLLLLQILLCYVSVNNILFKYKVHRDTADTLYIQYNSFERDTEISLRLFESCYVRGETS